MRFAKVIMIGKCGFKIAPLYKSLRQNHSGDESRQSSETANIPIAAGEQNIPPFLLRVPTCFYEGFLIVKVDKHFPILMTHLFLGKLPSTVLSKA